MAASASLLDDVHTQKVLEIWEALEATVGVKGVAISPLPHFSYMAARDFDLDTLQEVVAEVASKARPLMVRTAGVDREGNLWISLVAPYTYVYDPAGDRRRDHTDPARTFKFSRSGGRGCPRTCAGCRKTWRQIAQDG